MQERAIIDQTVSYVKTELGGAEGGHDWWHVYRVWQLSRKIGKAERANLFIVELAALLHDIADPKFHNGDETIGPAKAEAFLLSVGVEKNIIDPVIEAIKNISFKNSFDGNGPDSLEMKVVMDADRLDAMGAIGIARAFNYGGFRNRPIYDPDIKPAEYKSKEEYKKSTSPTLNHFYEKLLLLKDLMNTETGKILAGKRHKYMVRFLKEFFKEWNLEE